MIGRLLLPGEGGRRGLEVHAWIAPPVSADWQGEEEEQLWIFPDADGRFERELASTLTRATIDTGAVVHVFDVGALAGPDASGTLDLGVVDLRERLVEQRVRVVTAPGGQGGAVRLGLWIGGPPRGPFGGLPGLGSIQFPTRTIGEETAWLMPRDARDVYFLVERHADPEGTEPWFTGEQYVFGPFTAADFPLELVME